MDRVGNFALIALTSLLVIWAGGAIFGEIYLFDYFTMLDIGKLFIENDPYTNVRNFNSSPAIYSHSFLLPVIFHFTSNIFGFAFAGAIVNGAAFLATLLFWAHNRPRSIGKKKILALVAVSMLSNWFFVEELLGGGNIIVSVFFSVILLEICKAPLGWRQLFLVFAASVCLFLLRPELFFFILLASFLCLGTFFESIWKVSVASILFSASVVSTGLIFNLCITDQLTFGEANWANIPFYALPTLYSVEGSISLLDPRRLYYLASTPEQFLKYFLVNSLSICMVTICLPRLSRADKFFLLTLATPTLAAFVLGYPLYRYFLFFHVTTMFIFFRNMNLGAIEVRLGLLYVALAISVSGMLFGVLTHGQKGPIDITLREIEDTRGVNCRYLDLNRPFNSTSYRSYIANQKTVATPVNWFSLSPEIQLAFKEQFNVCPK